MAQPVSMVATVSLSDPGRGVSLADRDGTPIDRPGWASLDVAVEVRLDDATSVPVPDAYVMGRPLDCSRAELEQSVRDLNLSETLVDALSANGIETTPETLVSLPLTVVVAGELAARLP